METVIPSSDAIVEILNDVWWSTLEDPGELEAETGTGPPLPNDAVFAYVEIKGAWNGAVRVSCSRPAACHIASGMFAKSESEVDDDELADAVGEFTNIVGGNIKALFPSPCSLSLPGVAGIGAFADTVPGLLTDDGTRTLVEVILTWEGEPIVVTLTEGVRQ